MSPFSIVIICRNEAGAIAETLKQPAGSTDDIIVYDNGSTDGTQDPKVRQFKVHLHEGGWKGLVKRKQKRNQLAKYGWILSLDAMRLQMKN
ncbi:MAG: glycosyltransferase [Chitinophagaceae bacterium]|nr:glycosyltransferase [Chitinophagaceae bacterium]